MPTLTAATQTALAGPVTNPIFFIQAAFSTTLYWCTRSTTSWNGQQWLGIHANVGTINVSAAGMMSTSVSFTNEGQAISSLILSEGASGQEVTIWIGDASALADPDPVLYFYGATNGAVINQDSSVTLALRTQKDGMTFTPRQVGGPPIFNHAPAPGTRITIGGETYEISE